MTYSSAFVISTTTYTKPHTFLSIPFNHVNANAITGYFNFKYNELWDNNPTITQTSNGALVHEPNSVSINGRQFQVDTSFEAFRREAFRHRSMPPQRESINLTNISGEGTVNTEGLWRREGVDWSMGAGQQFLDRKGDSLENRFKSSKGLDPFSNPYQLTMLKDTTNQWPPTGTTSAVPKQMKVVSAGQYTYVAVDKYLPTYSTPQILRYSTLPGGGGATPTAIGFGAFSVATIYDITSNGADIWVATDSGIYQLLAGSTTFTQFMGVGTVTNASFIVSNCAGASAGNTYTNDSGFPNVEAGMLVTGAHHTGSAQVLAVTANSIAISTTLTAAATTDSLTFLTPANGAVVDDWKMVQWANDCIVAAASLTKSPTNTNATTLFAWPSTPASTTPSSIDLLMVHNNPNWNWTCATGGQSQIYTGGFVQSGTSTNSAAVYRISLSGVVSGLTNSVQPFALNYPTVALPLEKGEAIYSIFAYLNYIFIGTNLGVRMAETLSIYDPTATGTGDLKAGPILPNLLQPVSLPVTSFTANHNFVYFTWHNYDNVSTGIGRIDITKFIDRQSLAVVYCSDLMTTGQVHDTSGLVLGASGSNGVAAYPEVEWDNITNNPIITVPSVGIFTVANAYVPSGTVDVGTVTYGVPEPKIPVFASIDGAVSTTGNQEISITATFDEDTTPVTLGVVSDVDSARLFCPSGYSGSRIDVSVNLSTTEATAPKLYRWTVESWAQISTETAITAVLRFFGNSLSYGQEVYQDPYEQFMFLESIRDNQTIVEYIEGSIKANVVIYQLDWQPHKARDEGDPGFDGDCVVFMKTLGGYNSVGTTGAGG